MKNNDKDEQSYDRPEYGDVLVGSKFEGDTIGVT